MEQILINKIKEDFKTAEYNAVIEMLETVQLKHVMRNAAYNLLNTRHAILYLAAGRVQEVKNLCDAAQLDFRDVIYWAAQEKNKK